jgi:hypothetical protein
MTENKELKPAIIKLLTDTADNLTDNEGAMAYLEAGFPVTVCDARSFKNVSIIVDIKVSRKL